MAENIVDFADFAKGENEAREATEVDARTGVEAGMETGKSAEQELLDVIPNNQGGSEAA